MKATAQTLPLGIDIGSRRVRVALAQRRPDGTAELRAVATRACDGALGTILASAVAELQTRERRCVLGLGEPAALLRAGTFPPMRRGELDRAARFEAGRWVNYPVEEADVRVVPLDESAREAAIGIVRKDVIAGLRSTVQTAKLRLVAVDNNAFALRRAVPDADAVLDIGQSQSILYIFGRGVPRIYRLRVGGANFTQAIADALGTDEPTAERRKLTHGINGSAEDVRDLLVESVATSLIDCRANGYGDVRTVALVGNGARLDDLAAVMERATAVRVTLAAFAPQISSTLPPDVLRAAAPDWCQAYGLCLWAAA